MDRKKIFLAQMLGITLIASLAGAPIVGVPVIPILLLVCGWRYVAYYLSIFLAFSIPNYMNYLNPLIGLFRSVPKSIPSVASNAFAGLVGGVALKQGLLVADVATTIAIFLVTAFIFWEYSFLKKALGSRLRLEGSRKNSCF